MTTAGGQIFISYRRDDTAGYARALHDALAQQFGAERVFIDVDDIGAGQAFDARIVQAIGQARVLLVLIGPRWLAPHDGGPPRLHRPDDTVRQEVAAGLAGGLQVIPLLFDGAAMPTPAELPAPLQPLARRQALVMDARRFAADRQQLLDVLRQALGEPPTTPAPAPTTRRPPALLRAGTAGVAAAAVAAAAWWLLRPAVPAAPAVQTATSPASAAAPVAAPRAAVNGRWQADVSYDWPGARFTETLDLQGDGTALQGTASFLRVPRGIEGGQVNGQTLRFSTRSTEVLGSAAERVVTHRYSGTLVGDTLQLTMQTEGAAQTHRPVVVTAHRSAP